MMTPQEKQQELPTIWHVSDELWMLIAPLLAQKDPPKRRGRKRIDPRAALDAIIFRKRSGCQWNQLPQEFLLFSMNRSFSSCPDISTKFPSRVVHTPTSNVDVEVLLPVEYSEYGRIR